MILEFFLIIWLILEKNHRRGFNKCDSTGVKIANNVYSYGQYNMFPIF